MKRKIKPTGRRDPSQIVLRETTVGQVAYVKGTRLAVYWLADAVRRMGGNPGRAARVWAISAEKIRAALDYAAAYPGEMQAMRDLAEKNRLALLRKEAALARRSQV